jgi:pyridoxal biosynthesis lyase PdxS
MRVYSDSARIVPSSSAVSGMMLELVPAEIRVTVSTAGSKTLNVRVIMVCSAPTIAAAAGTGSTALHGALACPP